MADVRWGFVLAQVIVMGCTTAPSRVPPASPAGPAPERAPIVDPTPAPARGLPAEGTIDGGAGTLWYRITGTGPDTVLVPLGTWLAPGLQSLGERHTVVWYDPRHRGRSHALADTMAATFDGDVGDLERVRAFVGASRVSVIGYDYYAAVAAAWAAAHRQHVARLVLLSPIEPADSLARSWNPPERMARIDTMAARALVKARAVGRDTTDAVRYCDEFWRVNAPIFVGDTATTAGMRATWCQYSNETPAQVARAAERALASLGPGVDFAARAVGVSAPTLVLHGRLDLVANPEGAREWGRRISGARVLWLSNVGHLPHLEAPRVVTDAVSEFLAGGWPTRAGPP